MFRYAIALYATSQVIPEDWETWVKEGFDRAGVVGWLMEANNSLEKVTAGAVGLSALTDGKPMSRYAARNAVDALLGPSFGTAKDATDVLAATFTGNWSAGNAAAVRRLLPLQNLWYVRSLFDSLERGLGEALGVPAQ